MLNPDDLDSGEARSYFKIRRSAPADELGRRVLAHSGSRTPFARFTPSERATLETWAQALGCNAPSAHTSMTVRVDAARSRAREVAELLAIVSGDEAVGSLSRRLVPDRERDPRAVLSALGYRVFTAVERCVDDDGDS